MMTKKEIISFADRLAMDSAGNLLVTGHNKGQLFVYSPCGELIKSFKTGKWVPDVKIGNDGTIMVTMRQAMVTPKSLLVLTSNQQRQHDNLSSPICLF